MVEHGPRSVTILLPIEDADPDSAAGTVLGYRKASPVGTRIGAASMMNAERWCAGTRRDIGPAECRL
jgi:hypothetical protein